MRLRRLDVFAKWRMCRPSATLGDTGKKTDFWLEELAAPFYVFKDAGAEITLASPKGGQPPLDPKSDKPMFQTEPRLSWRRPYASIALISRISIRFLSRRTWPDVGPRGGSDFDPADRILHRRW